MLLRIVAVVLLRLSLCLSYQGHSGRRSFFLNVNRARVGANPEAAAPVEVVVLDTIGDPQRKFTTLADDENREALNAARETEHFYFMEPSPVFPNASSDADDEMIHSSPVDNELASRRVWMARVAGAVVVGGSALGGTAVYRAYEKEAIKATKKLAPVNITQVAKETSINITLQCATTCVSLDSKTFQKKQALKLPAWIPPYLIPAPKVIKDIPNSELLVAAIVAGSAVEMVRTTLLYPIQTLKTRIQTNIKTRERTGRKKLHLRRRIKVLRLNAIRHFREGNLYAGESDCIGRDKYSSFNRSLTLSFCFVVSGLLPSLLVSVPATGVYYGARDVTKRMLSMAPVGIYSSDLLIAVMAAFVADVVSLMLRTPVDTLALRLQVATGNEGQRVPDNDEVAEAIADALAEARVREKVGNWFLDSLERLPTVIVTDLPYLLSRIALNSIIIQGHTIDIGHYELASFTSAVLCSFLTNPFDVARTRILVDIDGGSVRQAGLVQTFRTIMSEGGGGFRNLFAGWLERTAYLGISSLWLPFALVFYIAIRDAILLEWFD
jgi:Mitochondrial carrier protein